MTWTNGERELKFSGSLPLEQGVAFEQAISRFANSTPSERLFTSRTRSTHCQYPGCTAGRELRAHHLHPVVPVEPGGVAGKTEIDEMILLCSRHHTLVHDHHIRTTGTGKNPVFTDRPGRAITANQPHAPPR